MSFLPIVPNCKCLIIAGEFKGEGTTTGQMVDKDSYEYKDRTFNLDPQVNGPVWEIDKLMSWYNDSCDEVIKLSLMPEANLMRIDGHTEPVGYCKSQEASDELDKIVEALNEEFSQK